LAALAVGVAVLAAPPAAAAAGPPGVTINNDGGRGSVTGGDQAVDRRPGGGGGAAPADTSAERCFDGGQQVDCYIDGGAWNSSRGCYVAPYPGAVPLDHAAWEGNTTGELWTCVLASGGVAVPLVPTIFWVPDGAAPVLIDPEVLVWRAIARLSFSAIDIGIVPEDTPGSVGLVGLPVWLWADNPSPTTLGPATDSESLGPVSVSLTAELTRVDFRMGDGTTIQCTPAQLTTPYEDRYGDQMSPTCGHRYTQSSAGMPGDAYTVSATSYWVVNWSGGGRSETIPLNFSSSTQVQIGELQVLVEQ
jgi:hypothetical protein